MGNWRTQILKSYLALMINMVEPKWMMNYGNNYFLKQIKKGMARLALMNSLKRWKTWYVKAGLECRIEVLALARVSLQLNSQYMMRIVVL